MATITFTAVTAPTNTNPKISNIIIDGDPHDVIDSALRTAVDTDLKNIKIDIDALNSEIGLITDNDTKNTAGSTNSTSKLYLVGAGSQGDNPQTYSNSAVYAENGALTSTSYNATTGNITAEKGNITATEGNISAPAGSVSSATLSTTGNATIGGTLGVTGDITSNTGNITATAGNVSAGGNVSAVGSVSSATLSTTGNASIGGTLGVSGNTTFNGDVTIAAGKKITGDGSGLTNISLDALPSSVKSAFSYIGSVKTTTEMNKITSTNKFYSINSTNGTVTSRSTTADGYSQIRNGDVLNVWSGDTSSDGMNYVWTGSSWDAMGLTYSIPEIPDIPYNFKTVSVKNGENGTATDVVADSTEDTITFIGGTGVSLSPDATNDRITINHSNSITAGTASGSSTKTLTYGSTFDIPTVTYDAQGHITSTGTTTITMPLNPNTDILVNTQASTSTTEYYLMASATTPTDTKVAVESIASVNKAIKIQPSSGTLTASKIVGDGSGLTNMRTLYATCSTASATAAKVATISPTDSTYVLKTGDLIYVKFTNANNVANATLNVNSKGAKSIVYNGTTAVPTTYWKAGQIVPMVYDGTNFVVIDTNIDTNTDTDTKNTAGSTNSTSKLYLVGASSQNANPQTYSNDAVYAENGALTSTSYNATTGNITAEKGNITATEGNISALAGSVSSATLSTTGNASIGGTLGVTGTTTFSGDVTIASGKKISGDGSGLTSIPYTGLTGTPYIPTLKYEETDTTNHIGTLTITTKPKTTTT